MQITIGEPMRVMDAQTNDAEYVDAWAAGVLEGRGRLYRKPGGGGETGPSIEVTATDNRVSDKLLEHYGGTVGLLPLRNRPAKMLYLWTIRGLDAVALLERTAPFMQSGMQRRAYGILDEVQGYAEEVG
jgi:hypothetical protein